MSQKLTSGTILLHHHKIFNNMKSKFFFPIAFLGFAFLMLAFQNSDWAVPAEYQNMKNPVAADDDSIDRGEDLWRMHCRSCHGKEGLGDGPKAAQLDTPSGDFSSDKFQAQSDGAIFYKSWIGRGDMPNYEKKIPDKEDVWHLVNFMRTMK
jgi:mono/diheme cytochrome c family protein